MTAHIRKYRRQMQSDFRKISNKNMQDTNYFENQPKVEHHKKNLKKILNFSQHNLNLSRRDNQKYLNYGMN